MHKLLLNLKVGKAMKISFNKNVKNKNIKFKSVNNHKTKIYHNLSRTWHSISKDWQKIYDMLSPLYQELERDFGAVDVMDLIYYERWLNE